MPIFECRALEKRYGAAMALDHIDLALEPGRIVGLLGPNGSGKSTLIKLAMGLLQPTSGEVLIGGQAPSPQTNAVVSYLPDRITLSPWMKTRQLLDFYGDFFADFDRAAAERMLSQLGLDLNQSVRQMSKGMKEKVQLVLTMSRRAKLYLLDEPENSLSPSLCAELARFIADSARFYRCQFIIATHSPLLLAMKGAKIYDLDGSPARVRKWTDLENVRVLRDFFAEHEEEFNEKS